jgi:hypothetical protein
LNNSERKNHAFVSAEYGSNTDTYIPIATRPTINSRDILLCRMMKHGGGGRLQDEVHLLPLGHLMKTKKRKNFALPL